MIGVAQKSLIKDPTNSVHAQRTRRPPTVILALSKDPSVPVKPSYKQGVDVDMSMDF